VNDKTPITINGKAAKIGDLKADDRVTITVDFGVDSKDVVVKTPTKIEVIRK
jgi:hypothetical protein